MTEGLGTTDVLIVGGGAIGLTTALELARRGHRPLLLERGPELLTGCSVGSAGLLSPGHSAPLANPSALREGIRFMFRRDSPFSMHPRPTLIPWLLRFMAACRASRVREGTRIIKELSLASTLMHEALAAQGLDTGFVKRGAINVYESDAAFEAGRREAEVYASEGIASRSLSTEEAQEVEPAIADRVVGAVHYPDEAHCEPSRFLQAIADAAREAGADLRQGVEVTGFSQDADGRVRRVETRDGPVLPDTVVIAAGAWTTPLSRALGVFIPIEGGKGYHVDFAITPGDPRIPVYMQEARVIATPFDGILRLSGTLQLTGLNERIDDVRVRATMAAGVRTLRDIAGRPTVEVWQGIRPCPPDGLPIIGVSDRVPNVVFASGHAMKGLHLAPVTARLVGQLVDGDTPDHDLAPMHPDRFRLWGRRKRDGRSVGEIDERPKAGSAADEDGRGGRPT